ncbi:acyl-CoA thioesterase [Arthrobacter cryoconiti]|uniref:Acyl-CoA thioesterase n=1 Tax=Arthrobacter cryoconiti TaxID=748907 RepID=A0ABV8R3G5_9MICC|nr:acyl-CoA thioesterase [Arthrobacter cryoconiti]MCC9067917.1 acyl-CoA thioesterase [Arthrobacter cryoconiti]
MTQDARHDGGARLTVHVPMRWGDMDAYGHINNVAVMRILEEARVHAFGAPAGTGAPGVEMELPVFADLAPGTQALVVEHRVKYLTPLNYRNIPARVDVWVSAIKGASFTIAYAIEDPVTRVRCVIAETVLAFLHAASGTVLRITPEKKVQLEVMRGAPNFR